MINELNSLETALNLMEKYDIPQDIKKDFLGLKSVMPKEDFRYFKEVMHNDIIKYNKEIKNVVGNSRYEHVKKTLEKAIKQVKSDRIFKYHVQINYDRFAFKEMFKEFDRRITENYKLSGLESLFNVREKNLEDFNLSESLIRIDKIVNGGNEFPSFMLNPDKKISNIVNNFKEIKEVFLTREKLIYTKAVISELLKNLDKEKCDFSDTKEVLNYMNKKYEKEIEKKNKYLNKFDLRYLEDMYVKEDKKVEHDRRLEEYKAYAYNLEEAKAKGDKEKQKEIEENMKAIASYGDLEPIEIEKAIAFAEIEYRDDIRIKEAEKSTRDKMQETPDHISIAKDYVRYVSRLKDKKDKISFAEFGKQKYNAVVNEMMLPEELKNEIKRKSK